MAWDFDSVEQFFAQFAGPANLAGASVFAEWSAADGFDLSTYPASYSVSEPTADAPTNRSDRVWVRISGGAWTQVKDVPNVTNIGIGAVGVLTSGVSSMMIIQGWGAKSIGFGYVVGFDTSLDQIHIDQTQGIFLTQCDIGTDGTITETILLDENFTSGDLSAINTWMGAHSVTPSEFATKMGWASASEGQTWMLGHTRREFLNRINEQWG